jgi:lysophospholipase L1-like esterase
MTAGAAALGVALLASIVPRLDGGPRVWCVGDSITHYYAPALVRLAPTWTVTDFGKGGERSDRGLVRLIALLATRPAPDVVVLFYGANDVSTRVMDRDARYGAEQAAANVREMAQQVRLAGAVPIVALPIGSPPPAATDSPEARANLRALRRGFARLRRALREESPYADVRLPRREMFLDALHPRPAGVQLIARRVASAVRRVLGRPAVAGTSSRPGDSRRSRA